MRGRTCVPFLLRACAGRVTFLATFCFVYPLYEVAMPSRQNVPFILRACAGRVTFLATFCFVYPLYEVAMPSRQNVRNARSRALRALGTPEEKIVRREIRNEKDRARRRRAKTKQKQVAKYRIFLFEKLLNVPNLFIRLFLRITVPINFIQL